MSIKIREVSGIHVLDIDGRIDINSSDIIETVGWLTSTGKVNIIINLESVDIVDYSGLSILAISYKNVINHKGKMRFLHVALPVQELFKVVKLDSVFQFYSDEETAVASFSDETGEAEKAHLRRRFKRLDIHLKVRYRLVGEEKDPKTFEGQVLNISAAGIYVYTPYALPINSLLDLQFNIPGRPAILEATGRIIWIADKEIQAHSAPGIGIAFVHLTPEKESSIIDFIDKNITHRADEPL